MSTLDILTPRGQETLKQEDRAVAILEHHFPAYRYIRTPKHTIATVDAVIAVERDVVAIAEMKCRTMSFAVFEGNFRNRWLVTYDKIDGARRIADALQVQFWGLLYLVPDDLLLCKTLYHPDSGWRASFGVDKTKTQATVNGGTAHRDNAYIDMASATMLHSDGVTVA